MYHPIQELKHSHAPKKLLPNPMNFLNTIKMKSAKFKKLNNQGSSSENSSAENTNTYFQRVEIVDYNLQSIVEKDCEKDNVPQIHSAEGGIVNLSSVKSAYLKNIQTEISSSSSVKSTDSDNNLIVEKANNNGNIVGTDCESLSFKGQENLFKMCNVDTSCNASPLLNNASPDGSDYSGYQNYRSTPRNARERDQDLRDQIEPLDSHHSYHHPNPNHHYNHHHHHREESIKRRQFTRSLSNTDPPPDEKTGKFTMFKYSVKTQSIYFVLFCYRILLMNKILNLE